MLNHWFGSVKFFFLESVEHTRSSIVAVRAGGVSVGLYSTIVGLRLSTVRIGGPSGVLVGRAGGVSVGLYSTIVGLRLSTVRIGGPSGVLVGLYCSLVGIQYGVWVELYWLLVGFSKASKLSGCFNFETSSLWALFVELKEWFGKTGRTGLSRHVRVRRPPWTVNRGGGAGYNPRYRLVLHALAIARHHPQILDPSPTQCVFLWCKDALAKGLAFRMHEQSEAMKGERQRKRRYTRRRHLL
jgi:hypothetical protein